MADAHRSVPIVPGWRIFFAGFYSLAVIGLSVWPRPKVPLNIDHGDLLAHGILYFFLAVIWLRVPLHWTMAIPLVSLFGVLMELCQLFIPGRSFSPADVLSNIIGILLACIVLGAWQKFSS